MSKLYFLSGMIALSLVSTINTSEKRRPEVYRIIDELLFKFDIDWPAIFKILDEMKNVINVNEYYDTASGRPLLIWAVTESDFLAVKELLEKYHANPNIKDIYHISALFTASSDLTIAQLLLHYGANPNIANGIHGRTALIQACIDEDIPIIRLLLQYGANPNQKDQEGHNCFDFAKNNPEILKILKEAVNRFPAAA